MSETNILVVPQMRGLPLIGNLLDIRYRRLHLLQRLSRVCGDIGAFRVGARWCILVNSPELIREVLITHASDFEKPALIRMYLCPALGNGLILSENVFHEQQRKLITPIFQHPCLPAYADIIASCTEQFYQLWRDGETLDIMQQMTRLTLWIIAKILFGLDILSAVEELESILFRAQRHCSAKFGALIPTPYTWPTPGNRRFLKDIASLDAIIYRMIQQKRQVKQERQDLLSVLLHAQAENNGNFMSDVQVRDEAMTMLMAGHENTANILAWTWYLLALHPEIYRRMCDEVEQILGERAPTLDDLPNLGYLQQILKEALRLYPPAYLVGRQAKCTLEIGGYRLPAGTIILMSAYTLHRRADYYPHPEQFDPERFSPKKEQCLPRYAYIPFGVGPRSCIGSQLAMMEGQIILAMLAQRVRFQYPGRQQVTPEPLISLRPKDGIKMVVRRNTQ